MSYNGDMQETGELKEQKSKDMSPGSIRPHQRQETCFLGSAGGPMRDPPGSNRQHADPVKPGLGGGSRSRAGGGSRSGGRRMGILGAGYTLGRW